MLFGDYYPLTPYSRHPDKWIGWQFNRPGNGDGVLQVFRRESCEDNFLTIYLRGLKPKKHYELINFDLKGSTKMCGRELMEKGLVLDIREKPGAAVITYREIK
jgi:hypothetical protein